MRRLLFALLLLPALAGAEIYRWTDAQGQVHFGEKPGAAGAETVTVKPQVTERDAAAREREEKAQLYFDARREEKAHADAQAATARAERAKECRELRSNLALIQRGGRYFVVDAKGERNYIDEAQLEAERNRLSSRIAQRCG